jgi:hypothetical protein
VITAARPVSKPGIDVQKDLAPPLLDASSLPLVTATSSLFAVNLQLALLQLLADQPARWTWVVELPGQHIG